MSTHTVVSFVGDPRRLEEADSSSSDLVQRNPQMAGVPSGHTGGADARGLTMTRTDDDTWDITESVGATALGVAAARAAETESAEPLFRDPFARVFLDAAGEGTWSIFDHLAVARVDQELAARMQRLQDFFAARTAFIDDFFVAAADSGIRQVVILAAGLDARAWRLAWPEGTRVYELDQPKVLEFKSSTLRAHGAEPVARRIEIPVDLRRDWPTALRHAGFDPQAPTAWSVEGLLRYLPSQAQDLLFERIQEMSAVGSQIVANAPTKDVVDPERWARDGEVGQRLQSALGMQVGIAPPNLEELSYAEERTDVVDWLTEHGWEASAATVPEVVALYRRAPANTDESQPVPSYFISACRVC
jgi:methyltransferase (TIGR00027 family)